MNIIIQDDGVKLDAVLDMPYDLDMPTNPDMPAGPEGKVPLCIILHGFTGNKDERHLIAVSDMMNHIGMATLRVDLYGHGKSDGEFRKHNLYKWINNAIAVIDYARELPYFSRIYICGHSQGGLTAIMAGVMKQDIISGILPMSPAIMIPEEARNGNILGTPIDFNNLSRDYTSKDGWTLNGNYVCVAQTLYPEETMKCYHGPVIVIHGDQDKTVPIDKVEKACNNFDNCTFIRIKNDTHCYDNHLDVVVEVLEEQLESLGWNR